MAIIHGITVLLVFQLVGEFFVLFLELPVPGPVVGMVLLFLSLLLWKGSVAALESSSTSILSHFSLLFVPAGVGMMLHFDRIANEWLSIGVALLLSTIITMLATAAIMLLASRLLVRKVRDDG